MKSICFAALALAATLMPCEARPIEGRFEVTVKLLPPDNIGQPNYRPIAMMVTLRSDYKASNTYVQGDIEYRRTGKRDVRVTFACPIGNMAAGQTISKLLSNCGPVPPVAEVPSSGFAMRVRVISTEFSSSMHQIKLGAWPPSLTYSVPIAK